MIVIMSDSLTAHFAQFKGSPTQFEAGDYLFRRDDPVRWLHRVDDGAVHLTRFREDGGVSVLQRAKSGAFLAEASLFASSYHCSALAIVPTEVTRFDRRRLLDALGSQPAFGMAWAEYLSGEVHRVRARAEILSQPTVAARLDTWLALNGDEMPAKGQWASLAANLGVSPEALYRLLASRR